MAKTEGDLPDSCFAYVPADGPTSDRKLRLCDLETGELDAGQIGRAAAAFSSGGFRGNKVDLSADAVAGAKAKVRAAWKKLHPDAKPDDMPEGIKLSEIRTLTESQIWLAEQAPTGFLVALWLDPETAAKLALPGGEPAEALHVTLCYCGDAGQIGDLAAARAVAAVEQAVAWRNDLDGAVAGYGRFDGDETSGNPDVFYASVDAPGLEDLRQAVDYALCAAGVPPNDTHGFTPHITLAYLAADAPNPVQELPAVALDFAAVTIMIGSRRIDIPLVDDDDDAMPSPYAMSAESPEPPLAAPLGTASARPLFFSLDQEWIPFLPKPGKYAHSVYGDLNLDPEKYGRILANFNANIYKQDLPINVEHDSRAAGAVGWIKPGGMRLAADGSLEVRPDWNETGRALLDGDRFRYVSAEFCDRWQDPVTRDWHSDVAVGLAICTRPHFKTDVLQPLAASEQAALALAQSLTIAGPSGKEPPMPEQTQTTTAAATTAEPPKPAAFVDLTQVMLTAEQRELERRQFADLTSRVELAERRATTAEAKLAALEKERRTERFMAEVLGRSEHNDLRWIGDPKEHVEFLTSLAEQFGDASPQVNRVIESERQKRVAIQKSGLFRSLSAITAGADGGLDEASRLAHEYQLADPKLTKEQATAKVFTEHPELYQRYLDARR